MGHIQVLLSNQLLPLPNNPFQTTHQLQSTCPTPCARALATRSLRRSLPTPRSPLARRHPKTSAELETALPAASSLRAKSPLDRSSVTVSAPAATTPLSRALAS